MTPFRLSGALSPRRRQRGFTLVEVLAALAVISVAITVIITLFVASVTLAKTNRSRKVAAAFAQEQLELLQRQPGLFEWPTLDTPGQLMSVTATSGTATLSAPEAMPAVEAAAQREEAFYDAFTWEAFARLPRADAAHVELTVVVRWAPQTRGSAFILTSAMPRASVEEAP